MKKTLLALALITLSFASCKTKEQKMESSIKEYLKTQGITKVTNCDFISIQTMNQNEFDTLILVPHSRKNSIMGENNELEEKIIAKARKRKNPQTVYEGKFYINAGNVTMSDAIDDTLYFHFSKDLEPLFPY